MHFTTVLTTCFLSPARLCYNPFRLLRATGVSVAISMFSILYEIVSIVSLPRNDITTQSLKGRRDLYDRILRDKFSDYYT